MSATRVTRETPWHLVLVLDDSESMKGEGCAALNEGLENFCGELQIYNQGRFDRIFLSVIKFGSGVSTIYEHTAETKIDAAMLSNFKGDSGSTRLDKALDLASDLLQRHPGKDSDFTPYVLVFTDGAPDQDDAASQAAQRLQTLSLPPGSPRLAMIGCGSAIRKDFMDRVATSSDLSVHLRESSLISEFFRNVGTNTNSATGVAGMDRAIHSAANIEA